MFRCGRSASTRRSACCPRPTDGAALASTATVTSRRLALIDRLQERGYSLAGIRDLWQAARRRRSRRDPRARARSARARGRAQRARNPRTTRPSDPRTVPTVCGSCSRMASSRRAAPTATACPARRCCNSLSTPSPPATTPLASSICSRPSAARRHDRRRGRRDTHRPSRHDEGDELVDLANRGRGLLAHGVGRLTIHTLGRRMGITDEAAVPDALRAFFETDHAHDRHRQHGLFRGVERRQWQALGP